MCWCFAEMVDNYFVLIDIQADGASLKLQLKLQNTQQQKTVFKNLKKAWMIVHIVMVYSPISHLASAPLLTYSLELDAPTPTPKQPDSSL